MYSTAATSVVDPREVRRARDSAGLLQEKLPFLRVSRSPLAPSDLDPFGLAGPAPGVTALRS